jgi:hypothetical protein
MNAQAEDQALTEMRDFLRSSESQLPAALKACDRATISSFTDSCLKHRESASAIAKQLSADMAPAVQETADALRSLREQLERSRPPTLNTCQSEMVRMEGCISQLAVSLINLRIRIKGATVGK